MPRRLHEMLGDPDRERAARVAEEMLRQVKLDLASLEEAYRRGPGPRATGAEEARGTR